MAGPANMTEREWRRIVAECPRLAIWLLLADLRTREATG